MPDPVLADSATKLPPEARAAVVVCGSHGGVYAAWLAARHGVAAVILNDAGVGREEAGIGGLAWLEALGIAAAAVGHDTARIGDATDMAARGRITHVNAVAAALGCRAGQECGAAARVLAPARPTAAPVPRLSEARRLRRDVPGSPLVWTLDSVSLVLPEDAGQIVVTGSHGGLLGGRPESALPVDALGALFHDAGIGIDEAGIGRLAPLAARGIAAATVDAGSARIGDGDSILDDGRLSRVNAVAAALGVAPGMTAKAFVERVAASRPVTGN